MTRGVSRFALRSINYLERSRYLKCLSNSTVYLMGKRGTFKIGAARSIVFQFRELEAVVRVVEETSFRKSGTIIYLVEVLEGDKLCHASVADSKSVGVREAYNSIKGFKVT